MLSLAAQDLSRRNPEMPGLALVLDPEAFLAALRRAFAHAGLETASAHCVRLEPHTSCRVAYRIEVAGEHVDLDARACRPVDLDAWSQEAEAGSVPGPLGPGCIVLWEHAVLVTVFPYDPELPVLRDLADETSRHRLLIELLPERRDLWSGELRRIRYRPGRRYVAELRGPDGARVLLKAGTAKGHERGRRNASKFRSSDPLRVAQPLGASDEHRLLAFEWLPGDVLFDRCAASDLDHDAVATAGAALAVLHAQSPAGLDPWTREAEIAELLSVAEEIGFLCPWLSRRAGALARLLAARLAAEPDLQGALHGDFSTRHVLVSGHRAGIVDLDWACRGDPADDLGSIIAQAERHALCGDLPPGRVGRFRDALFAGYGAHTRSPFAERVGRYTAVELFRGARAPFRRNEPEWPERVGYLLQRAEEISDPLRSVRAAGMRASGRP